MRRLISWVRPPTCPWQDSRSWRAWVARGSMAYSAVTQPPPEPAGRAAPSPATVAAQNTRVRPQVIRQEPSAKSRYPGVRLTSRRTSGPRPPRRCILVPLRTLLGATVTADS